MGEILIDVTRLVGRFMKGRLPTGVDRVNMAYIRRYGSSAQAFIATEQLAGALSHRSSQRLFSLLLDPQPDFTRRAWSLLVLSPPIPLSRRKSRGRLFFNVGHSGLERPGYAAWLEARETRPVFMVFDLIPITHPEYCRPGEDERHKRRMSTILGTGAGVIAISRTVLDDLTAYAKAAGQTLPPAIAAPLAAWELPLPSLERPLEQPYFVMLATVEPRKNHWMMLQVWRRLVSALGPDAPRLVLVGQRGWECENVVDLLERCRELQGYVIENSACTDAALATYLRHAQALLFPSFTEGFGLPLVEALQAGTPVIASDLPVFREVAGPVPDYLDPLDGMGWLATILEYCRPDSRQRAAQVERMKGMTLTTWDQHFATVDRFLEQLP